MSLIFFLLQLFGAESLVDGNRIDDGTNPAPVDFIIVDDVEGI